MLERFDFQVFGANTYVIITDTTVNVLYGQALSRRLKRMGLHAVIIKIADGEASKSWNTAGSLVNKLAKEQIDKDAVIVALGGGVVGDLSAFAASIYKRGIRYIHVPTTLLAKVDSSVGGKTGINIPDGKNLIGTIYQPLAVITDIDTLNTLPVREIRNGLAELVKYAVVRGEFLFEYLEENIYSDNGIKFKDRNFYESVISKACVIKSKIVERDEHESEYRKILNYGHTIGHAIEIASDYKFSHGEAVAMGMAYEGRIAVAEGVMGALDLKRQNALLDKIGFTGKINILDIKRLIEIMRSDKKNRDGKIYFIQPTNIGKAREENWKITFPVSENTVKTALA